MRARQVGSAMAVLVVLIVTSWGGVSPARSELKATVEDSTTIVVMRGDSVVFRKEIPFAAIIDGRTLSICEGEAGQIALIICYEASDTTMVDPLPRAYTHHAYKDLTLGFWRKHLLLIGCGGDPVIGHDLPWHFPGCKSVVFSDPDTTLLFYFDTGELVRIDLASGTFDLVAVSDWGHSGFPGEEAPVGVALEFPGDRVAVMRSGYSYGRSELALVSRNGSILWKIEDPAAERMEMLVDPENRLLVSVRRYRSEGVTKSYDVQVVDEDGQEKWVLDLPSKVVRKIALDRAILSVWVRQAGKVAPWERITVDARTGRSVEAER